MAVSGTLWTELCDTTPSGETDKQKIYGLKGSASDGVYIDYDGNQWRVLDSSGVLVPARLCAHAATHQHGGSDELATATPAAHAIPKADGSGTLNNWISTNLFANPVMNPFTVWQRGDSLTSLPEFNYGPDRWYALYQSATINVSRVDGDVQRYACRLVQPNATAQRLGIAQIIEGKDCRHLRGEVITFSCRVRLSAAGDVRAAVLSWTGTEDGDAVTAPNPHFSDTAKDVVNDWTSSVYTAGNFFKTSNVTVEGVAEVTCDGTNYADLQVTTSGISTSMNNLMLFVWSEGTMTQNATLDIEAPYLNIGSIARTFVPRLYAEELALCQRYYQVVPEGTFSLLAHRAGTSTVRLNAIPLPTPIRTPPTITNSGPGWMTSSPGSGDNAVAFYNDATSSWISLTGGTGPILFAADTGPNHVTIRITGGGGTFGGSTGDPGILVMGGAVKLRADAEL